MTSTPKTAMAAPGGVDDVLVDALGRPGDKDAIRAALAEARERTWLLVEGLDDEGWSTAMTDYLSPPNWDMGHIPNFEELWLVQNLMDRPELHEGFNDTYNAFAHPRAERPELDLMERHEVRAYMDEVRGRVLARLDELDLDAHRLTHGGFVHWMIILHEHQHDETLLQSLTMSEEYHPPEARALPAPTDAKPGWIDVPAGTFQMGTEHVAGVYDNEAPVHEESVGAFQIARYPVTNGEYLRFIEAGGYSDDRWWSPRGQAWRGENDAVAPLYWTHEDGTWHRRNLTGTAAVHDVADEILCHVSCFEAEAYAAWAGARLPTEPEWERACRSGSRNPWGDRPATTRDANIDQLGLGPSRAGAYPEAASWTGAEQMIGDVWEWTSSGLDPYPGFEAFPYDEYTKVFLGGDYRVLRGGSWATRAGCATGTFRNWDHPYRRQIFSGVRLARDVP